MKEQVSADARPYHHGDLRRALIDAALALVKEEQDWAFSLREVARRAGVSHNAPYNHFPEKRDLLGAIAATGFEGLRERMLAATAVAADPRAALLAVARAYVEAGAENPALYRLMFGPALASESGSGEARSRTKVDGGRPMESRAAGAMAKEVLDHIILHGAEAGVFAVSPKSRSELAMASLTVWASVHGLTMLVIDDLTGSELLIDTLVARLARRLLEGLEAR